MRQNRAAVLLVLGLVAVPADVSGQFGLAAGFGTTGLGADVAVGLSERLVVRVGAALSTLDVTTTFDGIPVELDLPRESYTGGLDFYFNSAFRIGAGVMVRPSRVGIEGRFGDNPVDVGGQTLTPEQIGTLTGVIQTKKQAPYGLIGFGKHVAPGVGLALDVGASYFGTPSTSLQATGGTYPAADLAPLLEAEARDFDDEMKTYMKVWPILRLAVRIGLGNR